MLIPSKVRDVLMYGSLALPLAGLLIVRARRRAARWTVEPALPEATVKGGGNQRRVLARFVPVALILGGLALCVWSYLHDLPVVRLTDDGVERGLAHEIDRPIAPGAKAMVSNGPGWGMWLVNDSSRTVRVETIQYATPGSGGGTYFPPVELPSGTAGAWYHIDYIGPKERPASSMMVPAMIGGGFSYWATWDEPAR